MLSSKEKFDEGETSKTLKLKQEDDKLINTPIMRGDNMQKSSETGDLNDHSSNHTDTKNLNSKTSQTIHRTIIVGKKAIEYTGPVNQDIMDLLDLIEAKADIDYEAGIRGQIQKIIDKIQEYNEKIEKKLTFFHGIFHINLNDIMIVSIWIILYAIACIRLKDFDSDMILSRTGVAGTFLSNGMVFVLGIILTFYSILILYIPKFRFILLIMIIQVVIPLFILLYDFNVYFNFHIILIIFITVTKLIAKTSRNVIYDYEKIILIVSFVGSFFYGVLIWLIRNSLRNREYGEIYSVFFMSLIHGIILQGVFVPLLMQFFTIQDVHYTETIFNIILTPVILFIIISWIFIHIRFFQFPLSIIEKNLKQISTGISQGIYKSELLNNLNTSLWWKIINRKINIISSVVIGTIYIYCEINLFLLWKDEILKENAMNTILCASSGFLMLLNPFFLIMGISIVVSNVRNANKFLYIPLLLGSFPMIGLIPLYSYFKSYSQYSILANVVFFGFPVGIFFWITMILSGVRHKNLFYSSITILCLFFLLPFAYFFPLNEQNAFSNSEQITTLIYVLGFIGAGLFAIIILFLFGRYIFKKFTKKEDMELKTQRFNLGIYLIANLKDCGFWLNSVLFMGSFGGLLYAIYYHSTNSAIDTGTLIGVLILIVFLFILMNVIIRIRQTYIPPAFSNNLSDKILEKAQNSEINQRKEIIRRKLFKCTIIFFIILVPSVCVPLIFIISDETISSTFKTVAAGGPLTFVAFGVLMYIKNRSGRHANFSTPSLVVLCWIFVYIPFCVLLPSISAFLQNHSQNYAEFLRLVIALTALMFMLGVTLFSIILNVILKRLEFEKKLRFILLKLKEELFKIAVRSDILTCRRLYEQFLLVNDDENYQTQLLDGNPVNWIPVKADDLDLHYSKQLITMEAYAILKRKKITNIDTKAMSCFEKCIRKCCLKEKKQENMDFDLLENALKNVRFDEKFVIIDDFLSYKFKRKTVELLNEEDERKKLNAYDFIHDKIDNKERQELLENQNLNNILDDPDFIKHGRFLRENFKSSKTPMFENIPYSTDEKEIDKIKYSEHALGMKNSMFLCEDWLIHLFDYFSIKDPSSPEPIIIYLDLYHMLRLGGIIEKTREYDIDYDDNSLITKEGFDYLNNNLSFVPLQAGILAINLEGFIILLVELSFLCFPDDPIEDSLNTLIHEFLYPNIMFTFSDIARNYKENIRAILKPEDHDKFSLEATLTNFKENNQNYAERRKKIKEEEFEKNRKKELFELKHRDNMLDVPVKNYGPMSNSPGSDFSSKKRYTRASVNANSMMFYASPLTKSRKALEEIKRIEIAKMEEKKKRINDKMQMLEILRNKYGKESQVKTNGCKRLFLKCGICCSICFIKFKICLNKTFKEYPKLLKEKIKKKLIEFSKKLGFKDDEDNILKTEEEKLTKRKEAPPWPDIVVAILQIIKNAEKEYDSHNEQNLILHFNLSNLIALIGKFTDLYTFANYAFKTGIPWFSDTVPNASVLEGSGPLYSEFQYIFWISLSCSILYALLSIPAGRKAKNGTLGMNSKTGTKAGFPHPQFLLTKGISILGSTLFLMIMRTFIDTFVCVYPDTSYWYLLRDQSIECLSNYHILYMIFSLVGIGLYYPMSTFFFPNFQFQDKALDVKYNPSFVVLQIQGKLIITGLGSLFASFGGNDFPLILQTTSTSIVLFLLAMASAKMKPCLIKKINLWDVGLYLLVSYLNACALFVLLSNNSIVGIIALSIGGSFILGVTLFLHRKLYGPFNCLNCNKNKVHPDEEKPDEEQIKEEESNEDEDNDRDSKNNTLEENKDISKRKKKLPVYSSVIVKNPEDYKF